VREVWKGKEGFVLLETLFCEFFGCKSCVAGAFSFVVEGTLAGRKSFTFD